MENWPTSATATGREAAPWYATQSAAWEALKNMRPTNYMLGRMLRLALCVLIAPVSIRPSSLNSWP